MKTLDSSHALLSIYNICLASVSVSVCVGACVYGLDCNDLIFVTLLFNLPHNFISKIKIKFLANNYHL